MSICTDLRIIISVINSGLNKNINERSGIFHGKLERSLIQSNNLK